MKRLHAIFSVLLVALVTGAWVIKESKLDEDMSFYVNDGGVVTKALEIDGATSSVSIRGTNTNDSATSGFVGERVTTGALTGTYGIGSTLYGDLGSISLTAGDWDISYQAIFAGGTFTGFEILTTGTAGNSASGRNYGDNDMYSPVVSNIGSTTISGLRVSLNATTTYYAKANVTYSVAPSYFIRLSAKRVR